MLELGGVPVQRVIVALRAGAAMKSAALSAASAMTEASLS